MLKLTSEDAVKRFERSRIFDGSEGYDVVVDPDTSLAGITMPTVEEIHGPDLIFIDAAHDYENVMRDLRLWWPKIRLGGMLCGHDFNHQWPGVERALADSFNLMDIGVAPDSVWFVVKLHEDMLHE